MVKVLVVEDEASIREVIALNLRRSGMEVLEAGSAEVALALLEQAQDCSAAILDVMLPGMNGFSLCETIRRSNQKIGIIILSAKGQEQDKIRGLSIGADDYMTKPFSFKEMVMRVNAQLRRYYEFSPVKQTRRTYGRLSISSDRFEVKVDGEEINLSSTEFRLLDFLTSNENRIMTKQQIIDAVWGEEDYIDENTVAVTISRLRDKLNKLGVNGIATVWGFGYKWQAL